MADGTTVPGNGTTRRLGKTPGSTGEVKRRAADVFDQLEAETARKPPAARPRPDSADVQTDKRSPEPTPGELVKKVQHLEEDRGFSITRGPDGATTVRMSGRIDPAVYADQKLPVPRQELRAYARSTQQWALMVSSFETSVVHIQALIATKLESGQITRAEAQEALRAQFAGARPDSAIPVLRFLADHPEYKDLFGIL